ncbi:MAG TPA: iron-sulfur cluster co-chaperone HscB C-terminal domain-containing protein [Phycisphaerales bacterium]|nr:iron-sulfur cluster co-chaperone HscB C-terminal domain-containing protein [Phycisphaerales bacterium]
MADAFEILGFRPRFDLDPAAVQRAYLSAVALCHPDLAGDDPDRAADAARRAAALNGAKAVLLDPEARARALLERLAVPAAGDERELPQGFLAEILETRMAAEEARAAADRESILRLRAWAASERERYSRRIAELFDELGRGGADRSERARDIRRELNAWRYIERMIEQVGTD